MTPPGREVCDTPDAGVISQAPERSPGEHWLDISNPLKSGFTRSYGGPGVGGHTGDVWQIAYGMDLGAPAGTPLYAAFAGTITGWYMGRLEEKGPPRYGAQVTVTSPNGKVAAFYTHFRNLPSWFKPGYKVDRGEYMGDISPTTGAEHLHLAVAEQVGSTFKGVNLLDLFMSTVDTDVVTSVTFFGDGRAPEAGTPRQPKEFRDEHYEPRRFLAPKRAVLLQRHAGNRAMAAALASPRLLTAAAALDARTGRPTRDERKPRDPARERPPTIR